MARAGQERRYPRSVSTRQNGSFKGVRFSLGSREFLFRLKIQTTAARRMAGHTDPGSGDVALRKPVRNV
jgi:hypothetical protein